MLKIYDVIIVGAGPAGLFAALELCKKGIRNILIIEKGSDLKARKKSETLCGVGGGGTFSDGKLHFSLNLSHEKLLDFLPREDSQRLINYVEDIFVKYGVTAPITPTNLEEVNTLVKRCQRHNIRLYVRLCRHVGSDALPKIISKMVLDLKKSKVVFETNAEVIGIKKIKDVFRVKTAKEEFNSRKVLLAPGRVGAKWLQDIAGGLKISYEYQKVEAGVRVEFPASVMEDHSKVMYENIYSLQTPTFDDTLRTFCPCPGGLVAVEDYGGYVCVNGHSNSDNNSPNSNFALLQEVMLTEPIENTTDYVISIAKLATTLGGGKPIIQRLMDLKNGRRSTEKRIQKSLLTPTLKDSTPGDISMALPFRMVTNILEALEILDKVLPGVNAGSNFLYAPEIKLRGSKIKTDKNLQTEVAGLYVAGDGAGASGNIVGAAATGIISARGMSIS
ncbi:NAD(P)/FAD-dependent oxidoreductase [Patescibacteria group bacterium]|nr:NAD(P)/FAD-dependent oxidoreductase [Patescibacteria group bacterium]